MRIRRFNSAGIDFFRHEIEAMAEEARRPPPTGLLEDDRFTEVLPALGDVTAEILATRMEAALRLNQILGDPPPDGVFADTGLWAWLTLFFFDSVCPQDESGGRKRGALARYIPEGTDYRRYYRHLLAGPYRILRAHRDDPDRAMALLCAPPWKPGDIVEQLASRQELITNPVLMEVATRLYYDSATKSAKRGAGAKSGGAARRLAAVVDQFDVTWDLFSMPADALLKKLPKEFDRFRKSAASA